VRNFVNFAGAKPRDGVSNSINLNYEEKS